MLCYAAYLSKTYPQELAKHPFCAWIIPVDALFANLQGEALGNGELSKWGGRQKGCWEVSSEKWVIPLNDRG